MNKNKYLLGVMGDPIAHSLSPAIFSWLQFFVQKNYNFNLDCYQYQLPAFDYLPWQVTAAKLPRQLQEFRANSHFLGCNVTTPLKEEIIPHLDEISSEALAIGAVNTVVHDWSQQKLKGFNTDIWGLQQSLGEIAWGESQQKAAWILGAGGAARSVAYILGKREMGKVVIFNRHREKAAKLIIEMQKLFPQTHYVLGAINPCDGEEQVAENLVLVVNATPWGIDSYQKDFVHSEFIFSRTLSPIANIKKGHENNIYAMDLLYRPQLTPFLKLAQEKGMQTFNGLSMLVWQALGAAQLFWPQFKGMDLAISSDFNLKNFIIRKLED